MRLRTLIIPVFTITVNSLSAVAQSDASCLPYYNWTFNSAKKSPCDIASSLLSVCAGSPYPVHALPDNSHYVGPTLDSANPCQCNTVVYSLMSACGACQGRSYLSWSVWTANCPMVSTGYPESIPSGLAIPGWAYLDVKTNDNFDQSGARDHSNSTESTAVPSPTSSRSQFLTTTTLSSSINTLSLGPTQPAADNTASILNHHANAVGGGVVGGLFGLLFIAGAGGWYYFIRKRRRHQGERLVSPRDVENPSLPFREKTVLASNGALEVEAVNKLPLKQSTNRQASHSALNVPPILSSESSASSSVEFANLPDHHV
ncbi:hypothetical protein CPB83DRAFT_856978 [Crepidotus variabilis]|uniref:Uncharacterized protein n=1 Tax=Crepidotus variabilis TaxID=179855 RepID=A0A9P6EDN3_9AGAR|nr:hypothetical protein CPB83DRAFT_856978 [Crepidotus variabilis]